MLKKSTVIILGVVLVLGGIAGFLIAKWLSKRPMPPAVFEELVGKKELVLAKNTIHKVYAVCPDIPNWLNPKILIIWHAVLEYQLDLKTSPLKMAWRGDSLEVKAPAIQLKTPTINTKDFFYLVIKGRVFVNEEKYILAEFRKATDLAYALGIASMKNPAIENLVRSELESFLKDIALGMQRPVASVKIAFEPAKIEDPKPPAIYYCKDVDLGQIPQALMTTLSVKPPVIVKGMEWKANWGAVVNLAEAK
jgi:hypothetical protein